MKRSKDRFPIVIAAVLVVLCGLASAGREIADERPLWPDGVQDNPIVYENPDRIREYDPSPASPSGSCRVYSHVCTPTFSIYRPDPENNKGVGVVIYPGGGFRDVWIDKEGHDYALFLKERGIASLVLKYRTNTPGEDGRRVFTDDIYDPAVLADAREAIRAMRRRADELAIDPDKIGIMGSSAGGSLALMVSFSLKESDQLSRPDFVCLVYTGVPRDYEERIGTAADLPPMFLINGQEDEVTPPEDCVKLYLELSKHKTPVELHVVGKGAHGFGLATGQGFSAELWTKSFLAWLRDMKFVHK